ncbi:MAG: PD-(D/E)XK nuclease family transposase [Eubacterium sp.]|nr:PD-(D/E)XK nuclease family transposase [Eubacterium sp.]
MDEKLFQELPQKMNLVSDLFSRAVFSDREACQDLVRIVLGEGFLVTKVTPQYDISNLQFRGVVLDILAETAKNKPIHIEFQIENNDDHFRRVRYCNGSMDTHILKKGQKFRDLPDIYHIFITLSDFIGGGKTVYEVFRTVKDSEGNFNPQYSVENGVHELYINLEIPLDDGSELDHLLRYIKNTTTENEDNRFPHIISSVKACRKEGNRMKYYSSQEFFEEGRKEGREEGHNSVIRKMLSMGQSVEFISQCTGRSADYIQQIAQEELMLIREKTCYTQKEK